MYRRTNLRKHLSIVLLLFSIYVEGCKKEEAPVQNPDAQLPDRPRLLMGDSSSTGNYVVRWTSSKKATSYTLQESREPSFDSTTFIFSGIDTFKTVSGKPLRTAFYYRVRSHNNYGSSDWSATKSVIIARDTTSPSNVIFPASSVSYSGHVQILFNQTCALAGCHSAAESVDRLKLDSYENLRFGVRGLPVVVPGNAGSSELVLRIQGGVGQQMPLNRNPLNLNQINGIRTWINEGALRN